MKEYEVVIPNVYKNNKGQIIRANTFSLPAKDSFLKENALDIEEEKSFVASAFINGEKKSINIYKIKGYEEELFHHVGDCKETIIIYNNVSKGTILKYQPISNFAKNHELFGSF